MTQGHDALNASIDLHFLHQQPASVGVAVSGGSDSMALLHLVAEWAATKGITVRAATVDHGLRAEAKAEIRRVAATCERLNLPHDVLEWSGWDGGGNLQAEARQARYDLLSGWGRSHGVDQIVLGHTQNDQAETFLMRLSRKSGVDGLAAMDTGFDRGGQRFGRPLLDASRDVLRQYLTEIGQTWCEDVSNQDTRFDRVKARKALGVLGSLGIDANVLSAVSQNLSLAKSALDHFTRERAPLCSTIDRGDLVFDRQALMQPPTEIEFRLLVAALKWVSGARYAPRSEAMMTLIGAIEQQKTTTLSGCLVTVKQDTVRIARELKAVDGLRSHHPIWDRWALSGPWQDGMEIRALGEDGIGAVEDWRASGLPRVSLLASPSAWYNGTLIAAPLAGFGDGWTANLLPERANFLSLSGPHPK